MEAFSRTDAPTSTEHDPAPIAAEPGRADVGAAESASEAAVPPPSPSPAAQDDVPPDAPADPDASARRRWLPLLLIALAVAVVFGAWKYIDYRQHGRFIQSTNDAYVRADAVTVSSKLAGYVRAVDVRDNQRVDAGQLLLSIDPTDYQTRIDQAQAQIEAARAGEQATLSNLGEAGASVAQARAALAVAQRDVTYLNGEIARYAPLVASGAEPRTALTQLQANRDKALAEVAARQAAIRSAESRITSIRSQAGQSAAQIRTAQVQQRAARNDLSSTRLTAPLAGTVASASVRTGQFVQPGQRLLTIVPAGDLYVEANFKETQIGLMRPGQPVTIHVDALPDVAIRGVVDSITPGTGANFSIIPPQNATGNFTKIVQRVPVRIRLQAGPETRRVLIPGLSLEVAVDTSSARGALDAIAREQAGR